MAVAGSPVAALRAVSRSLDRRVAATPAGRDRTVDLMRAVSIAVVVLWHWAGSVTHHRDGEIVMPNPIDQVPLLWLATWVGQVMPVFFLVGGFANLAAWVREVGSPRGISPRGSHGTERDSLPSFRSSHPLHRYARIHSHWANSFGSLSVTPRHQALNRFQVRSRLYFFRAQRIT